MVTRGNVAIYCYNALTARTWDVTSSEDGKLTSSSVDTTTILEKYFSEFTNKDGDMKLVEGLVVSATPVTNKTIGTNQIVFADVEVKKDVNLSAFLGLKAGGKNREEKTYVDTNVIAYVEETACANLGSLANKTVDVIFGKDNKVVYLQVTNDTVDGAYVTAWDGEEIEIDGEVYELSVKGTEVSLYGTKLEGTVDECTTCGKTQVNCTGTDPVHTYAARAMTGAELISELFTKLNITDTDRAFNRSVKANVILDEDEEIEKIDFIVSDNISYTAKIQVKEFIVKSISSKGRINAVSTNSSNTDVLEGEFEKIEENVRVIKDNEIVSLEDIKVGDVLTVVYDYSSKFVVDTVYVASARAEGEITRLKTNNYTLDGEDVYYTVNEVIGNSNGDIEEAEDVADLKDFYGEEVEFYLNYMGEVVAVVANTEATDSTLGIVTTAATVKTDADDVDYLSVRILTADGEARYKVYNKKAGENYDDATAYGETFTQEALAQGAMVIFAADADNVIKSNEIEVVDNYVVSATGTKTVVKVNGSDETDAKYGDIVAGTPFSSATMVKQEDVPAIAAGKKVAEQTEYMIGSTVVVKEVIDGLAKAADLSNSKQKVTESTTDYKFGSAVLFNTKTDKEEVIKGWSSICNDSTTYEEFNAYNGVAFFKKNNNSTKNVLFYVASIDTYVSEEAQYAALVDIEYTTNDDEEDVYIATLYVDGDEVSYEVDTDRASISGLNPTDFVTFELSDGEIVDITKVMDIYAISKLDSTDAISTELKFWDTSLNPDAWADKAATHKGFLEVGKVYATYFEYIDEFEGDANDLADLDINEDGYIIYDLRDGFDMFDGDITNVEGLYVYGFETEVGEGYDVFVVID